LEIKFSNNLTKKEMVKFLQQNLNQF